MDNLVVKKPNEFDINKRSRSTLQVTKQMSSKMSGSLSKLQVMKQASRVSNNSTTINKFSVNSIESLEEKSPDRGSLSPEDKRANKKAMKE